ncbi:MAG TPA: GspH/FimT family pseudopilin [Aromatoleum sp.]|uniref:GspH/FimT family pseudopilin n=1 Tax=Aromatoleum sp. TaxID=2307007 RepID=UPI002B467FBC|nr:GspH/FimT family pseudopilin [Aromatoleum sp.]HJV25675.1 GspH/FimT family pseudopilin [Aromatoleum sp.]
MSNLRARGGFTLVELIVTMAILGIILAMAVPNLQTFIDKNRVVGAAEAVYGQLQLARTEAIKQSANMVAVFTPTAPWCSGFSRDTGTVCDCTQAVGGANACTILGDGQTAVLQVVNASSFSGVTMLTGGPASIAFNGVRGTAGVGGTVILQSALGKQMGVTINVLGGVHVCSPTGSGSVGGYPAC